MLTFWPMQIGQAAAKQRSEYSPVKRDESQLLFLNREKNPNLLKLKHNKIKCL